MKAPSKCVVVKRSEIDASLKNSSVPGKRLLEPLKSFAAETGFPGNILEDRGVVNDAEVHRDEGDLWLCLEGEVAFTYGGELVDPVPKVNPDGTRDEREWKAKKIVGGTEVTLHPGDWLWVPPGEPHQHGCRGTARLFIVKVPNRP